MLLFYNFQKIPHWERLISEGHLKNFLKSDIVVKAIYSDSEMTRSWIGGIYVVGSSPGYNEKYPYAGPGVSAIKTYLSKGH